MIIYTDDRFTKCICNFRKSYVTRFSSRCPSAIESSNYKSSSSFSLRRPYAVKELYEYHRQTANNRLPPHLRSANMSYKSLRFFAVPLAYSLTRTAVVNLSSFSSECRVAINVIKLNLNYRGR